MVAGGSNGTLTIDAIHVIVAEFELEGACDDRFDDDCEEVETGPFLVEIPTRGEALRVATAWVPLGSYTELEWEVEDLDLDDDDFNDQDIQGLRSDIDALVGAGAWPEEASMVVMGSFQADGETTTTPYTTYFAAEIEVEMDMVPPLDLSEEGASRELTIVLSPDIQHLHGRMPGTPASGEPETGALTTGEIRPSCSAACPCGLAWIDLSFPLPRDLRLGAPLARGFSCGQSPRSRLAPSPNPGRAASRKPSLPEATSAGFAVAVPLTSDSMIHRGAGRVKGSVRRRNLLYYNRLQEIRTLISIPRFPAMPHLVRALRDAGL